MGLGDVKLAGVIGLMTGYPLVVAALAIGIVLGGVAAIALLVTRRAAARAPWRMRRTWRWERSSCCCFEGTSGAGVRRRGQGTGVRRRAPVHEGRLGCVTSHRSAALYT